MNSHNDESVDPYSNEYNQYETPTPIYTPLNSNNKIEHRISSVKSPSSIKKPIAPKLITPKLTPQPSISPPDYNYDSISQQAIPSPSNVEKQTSAPTTGVPPPPPPPPPPFLLANQPPADGLLKFTKTKPVTTHQAPKAPNKTENPMNDLQRELESKLIKVKQSLEQTNSNALSSLGNNNNENYATIRRFDPDLITGPKEVSFNENMALNALNTVLDDKENDRSFTFDPKETFTSKAKNALEKYKISKSSSSSEKSPNSSVELRIKNKNNTKKHAPFPFQMNQS